VKFQTLSLSCFNKYRELYYNSSGIKIIPEFIINEMTPRSLAYWFMDDGYKTINGYYYSTESYSLDENNYLCYILNNKFNIESKPHKTTNGYRIYIPSSSKDRFKETISPFIISHFNYKFH
jgi:LAGLIDADG DNA endonuclease family